MIITDQKVQGAPMDLVMHVELNDERRVDRTVLMDRMVIMAPMVHTAPAALPAGSNCLANSCSISRDALASGFLGILESSRNRTLARPG